MKETYPAGYATTPVEGAHASPALLGTVRPKTLSSLTWKKRKRLKRWPKMQVIDDDVGNVVKWKV